MRLPFFRFRKNDDASDSNSPTAAPPAVATAAKTSSHAARTAEGEFEFPVSSLLSLLPESAVKRNGSSAAGQTVSLPLRQILPQLAQGRVLLPVGDLLARLPSELVTTSLPYAGSEKVSLPIDQLVAHLAPETLQTRSDQREVDVTEDIPAPFAEDVFRANWNEPLTADTNETVVARGETSPVQTASESAIQPTREITPSTPVLDEDDLKPLFEPLAGKTTVPASEETAPSAADAEAKKASSGAAVTLKLGDVLEGIPDSCLASSRESLLGRLDLNTPIALPLDEIVPQLGKGRITIALDRISQTLPTGVLGSITSDSVVSLGVQAVIEQLPTSVFSPDPEQNSLYKELETIPSPFQEKQPLTADPSHEELSTAEAKQTEQPCAESPAPQITRDAEAPSLDEKNVVLFKEQTPEVAAPTAEEIPVQPGPEVPAVEQAQATEAVPAAVSEPVPVETGSGQTPSTDSPEAGVAEAVTAKDTTAATTPAETVIEAQPSTAAPGEEVHAKEVTETVNAETAADDTTDLDEIALVAPQPVEPGSRVLTPEEIAQVVAGLNAWSESELHQHNLGPTLSQRFLDYRATKGGFKDPRELLSIAGIGPRLFEKVLGFRPDSLDDQAHAINRLLGVAEDHEMTLQEIVKCTSRLPGVEGCIVAMSDGLYMTGEMPSRFDTQRVSAFAPQLFARVAQYVRELNVGTARRFTVFTDAQPITIFKSGDLFLIVIHKANRFSKALLNKCERISHEIARLCAQETVKS